MWLIIRAKLVRMLMLIQASVMDGSVGNERTTKPDDLSSALKECYFFIAHHVKITLVLFAC